MEQIYRPHPGLNPLTFGLKTSKLPEETMFDRHIAQQAILLFYIF